MKARMNVYFEAKLLQKVDELAARRNLSKSLIIEAAVASFLSPDAEDRREAAMTRRLDGLFRKVEQLDDNLRVLSDALLLYVQFWLTVTPPMPESEQATARKTGTERYEAFVESLGRRIAKGHNFLHEVAAAIERSQATPSSRPTDVEDARQ